MLKYYIRNGKYCQRGYDLVMKAIVLQPSIAKIPLDENQVDTIFASKDTALGKSEKYREREIKIIRLEVLCCLLYL